MPRSNELPTVSTAQLEESAERRRQSEKRRRVKKRALGEALEACRRMDIQPSGLSLNTATIWGEVLDRVMGLFRYVGSEVDALEQDEFWVTRIDAQGNELVEPHRWIKLEMSIKDAIVEIVSKMDGLDIESRRVAIEEAQAMLVARFMDSILGELELTPQQQAKVGAAVEKALPIIEGTATLAEVQAA